MSEVFCEINEGFETLAKPLTDAFTVMTPAEAVNPVMAPLHHLTEPLSNPSLKDSAISYDYLALRRLNYFGPSRTPRKP